MSCAGGRSTVAWSIHTLNRVRWDNFAGKGGRIHPGDGAWVYHSFCATAATAATTRRTASTKAAPPASAPAAAPVAKLAAAAVTVPVGEAVRQVERVLVEVCLDNERQRPKRLGTCSRKLVLEVARVRPCAVPPHTLLLRSRLEAGQHANMLRTSSSYSRQAG